MNKKVLVLTLALALFVLPFAASAAVIGPLTVSSTTVNQSGSVAVSGSCGNAGANGNVSFHLNANGANTSVGSSVTANVSGQFNTTVFVPNNYNVGAATIVATCPNGDTLVSALNVTVPLGSTLNLGGTPTLGQSLSISGICGTTAVGGTVNVSLVRMIGTVNLGTTTTTDANGNFSGSFVIPANAGGGPVQIVAACPTGSVMVNSSIVDPTANVSVGDTTPAAGGIITVSGVCGTTPGRPVTFMLSSTTRQVELGSTLTTTNGNFSGTLTIPANFSTGNATLVAFCPTGNVVTALVSVDPATGGGSGTGTGTGTGGTGVGTNTTPAGGVAAGSGISLSLILAVALLTAGFGGLLASKRMQNYSNEI